MDKIEDQEQIQHELKCSNCASILKYKPDTTSLQCEYCGTENTIEQDMDVQIEEVDYENFINNKLKSEVKQEITTVKCNSCSAETTLKPNVTSDQCPFCGTSLILSSGTSSSVIKPKSMLPFKITQKEALDSFRSWIKKLWFAPNKLKKFIHSIERLIGMYIPYWTYDSDTNSRYSGARGTYYYVSETYTTSEGGKTVTKTRQVRKTRWSNVSGRVSRFFDDVLVPASNTLPKKYLEQLEPWDTNNLIPFDEKFLSGFKTESYQVGIKEGFGEAQVKMDAVIRQLVRQDIGGDEQRINSVNTNYDDITFKHVLFPLWISSYQYNNKVYRFLINARTGEVKGERPYSAWKIAFAILLGIVVIGGAIYLINRYGG